MDVVVIGVGFVGFGVVEEIGGKFIVVFIEEKGWFGGDMWFKGVE